MSYFECRECDCFFVAQHDHRRHMIRMHQQNYFCSKCDRSYLTQEDLNIHAAVLHDAICKCPLCPLELHGKDDLRNHVLGVHIFKEKTLKKANRRISSKEKKSLIQCNFCSKGFNGVNERKMHVLKQHKEYMKCFVKMRRLT